MPSVNSSRCGFFKMYPLKFDKQCILKIIKNIVGVVSINTKFVRNMESKFDWPIQVSQIYFRVILSMAIAMILFIMCLGAIYTVTWYDAEIAFNAAVTLEGLAQVRIVLQNVSH